MNIFDSLNLRPGKLTGLTAALGMCVLAANAQPITVGTKAGYAGKGSADGQGSAARFLNAQGVVVDGAGNVYVADTGNNTIRMITAAGISSTLAGIPGVSGSSDGIGTNALFNQPCGIALDKATNIYVSDYGNSTIRMVTKAGVVTTFAGYPGLTGSANASGTNATFFEPMGLAVDSATNVYVADYGNHLIRKITPGATVSTFAGLAGVFGLTNATGTNAVFYEPEAVTVDGSGNVYVADTGNNVIRKITSGGVVSTFAGSTNAGSKDASGASALFYQPTGIAINSAGTLLYVSDYFNNTLRQVTSGAAVTTLAGTPGTTGSADGANATARFWGPQGVAVDSNGKIYVADSGNGTIRVATSGGVVSTLAGSPSIGATNSTGINARFYNPGSVAVDASTNVYVADAQNHVVRKVTAAGVVSILAGTPGVAGSADGTGSAALFSGPQGITVDGSGNVYVADTGNHTVRKITSGGAVSTLAGFAGNPGNADGTGTTAQFAGPEGVAVDNGGNVYVSDTLNHTIREISPSGATTTIAGLSGTAGTFNGTGTLARFNCPAGLALDNSGNVLVADYNNHTVRMVAPGGVVTTLAGLPGVWGSTDGTNSGALFFGPAGVDVDGLGNVYVADSGNHTLRKLTPSGANWVSSTVAGTAGVSGSADGVGGTAGLFFPMSVVVDPAGYLFLADSGNNTVRFAVPPLTINKLLATAAFDSSFITWGTPVEATTQVLYGLTPSYGNSSALDTDIRIDHTTLLTHLTPNATYYYEAISTVGTNVAMATGTFMTGGPIIVQAPQAIYNGVWTVASSATDKYSSTYKFANTVVGSDTAQAMFQPTIPVSGYYDVYVWYSEGPNRSTNAPLTTVFQNGSVATNMNETVPGGQWQLIAPGKYFLAGANGFVRMGNGTGESGKVVIADAVEWIYSTSQDAPTNGVIPAWWSQFYFGTDSVNGSAPGSNGYSLFANYVIGTSPTDPNSTLSFTIKSLNAGSQATFSPYQSGNVYGLQKTAGLLQPGWTNMSNITVSQNTNGDGVINFTNTGAQGFYRLSVRQGP